MSPGHIFCHPGTFVHPALFGSGFGPKFGKVGTIGAQIGPSGHYRGWIWVKIALSEVDLDQNLAKWALSWVDLGQVGTIGGGCGPRVDLDALSKGENGRFLDTIDKIKGSSGQLGLLGSIGPISPNDLEHPIETLI